jgi:hypothetical protein
MKSEFTIFLSIAVITLALIQNVNALSSVKLDCSRTTITLNETVQFRAEVNPTASIIWYCNDTIVQSEYSSSSSYTFIPKAIGTYFIKLSVDGFTNPPPSGPTRVTVVHELGPSITPTEVKPSPTSITNDQHFTVKQKLWAFDGSHLVCSFSAAANDYLEFNIFSTNSDPERPNDVYIIEFKIESINHGTSYVTGTTFNQKVSLNYTDTYNVSVAKHPFFATVTVNGTIDLRQSDIATPTPTPTLTVTQTPTTTLVQSNAAPTVPIAILVLALAVAFSIMLYRRHRKT